MARKAVFLDVDGTYADHGEVPPEHEDAVRAARDAGHRVFLCTGRPRSMLPTRLTGVGFDGIVASAGAWAQVDDEVLADRRFPAELGHQIVGVLRAHGIAFVLEAPDACYESGALRLRFEAMMAAHPPAGRARRGPMDIVAALAPWPEHGEPSFAKITFVGSPLPPDELARALGEKVMLLPSSIPDTGTHSGEIQLAGLHKAVGVQIVAAHLGVARADVVAFGDGANDVEMIAWAGTGVAIRGGNPGALAVADALADGPGEAGLARAFVELGLTA